MSEPSLTASDNSSSQKSAVRISAPAAAPTTTTTARRGDSSEARKEALKKQGISTRKALLDSYEKQFGYDDNVLHRAIADAGRWAFGIVFVEMWVLSDDRTCLYRPDAGWWVDSAFHSKCDENCQICRIVNPLCDDFMPATPVGIGEGLPGILWSAAGSNGGGGGSNERKVAWRQIRQIAEDPDQPWNQRLNLLLSLGLGWAAAVSFNFQGTQGMVIYAAREGVDLSKLQSNDNEFYLKSASDFAGAAYSLKGPRALMVNARHNELAQVLRRVRAKLLCLVRMGINIERLVEDNSAHQQQQEAGAYALKPGDAPWKFWIVAASNKIVATFRKIRGGTAQAPPRFTLRQCIMTFVGCFITMVVLTQLDKHLVAQHGKDYGISIGTLASFVALLFGLTAAPASQPRNAVLGQVVCVSIGIIVSYTEEYIDPWLRQSFATSVGVTAMVAFSLIHPPGGGSALAYSTLLGHSHQKWLRLGMLVFGYVVAIACSAVINNFSDKRQYPQYWGAEYLAKLMPAKSIDGDKSNEGGKDVERPKEEKKQKSKLPKGTTTSNNNNQPKTVEPHEEFPSEVASL